MTETQTCKRCGATLPTGLFGGRCPKCLMRAGIESDAHGPTGWTPPTIEQLAREFPQLELIELVGRGGMGAVYKARQPGLDRYVALKVLPEEVGEDVAFAERFEREARLLAQLDHPSIVRVHDAGRQSDRYYFLMEFVDGRNLRQLIRAGDIRPAQALAIVTQVCDALQYAHDNGVVHRDIKPENILVDTNGRVKIADFGLAKLAGPSAAGALLTRSDQAMGTMHYMAPEQLRRPLSVDHRADIYSLGVVFYELLTGEVPIGAFPPPSQSVSVDVRLDEVVLKSLAREPEQRYQRADEVRSDVQSVSDAGLASPAAAATSGAKSARPAAPAKRAKTPGWVFAVVGCLVIPLGLGVLMVLAFLFLSVAGDEPMAPTGDSFGPPTGIADASPVPQPIPAESGTWVIDLEPGEHAFRTETLLWRDGAPVVDLDSLDRQGVDPAAAASIASLVDLLWPRYRALEREATGVAMLGESLSLSRFGMFGVEPPERVVRIAAFASARRELADLLEESLLNDLGPQTWHAIGGTTLTNDLFPFGEQVVVLALDRGPRVARIGTEVPGEMHRERIVARMPDPLLRFYEPAPLATNAPGPDESVREPREDASEAIESVEEPSDAVRGVVEEPRTEAAGASADEPR